MDPTTHILAFLLAIASSTDNFVVGFGVGFAKKSLKFEINLFISICNGFGAFLASGIGGVFVINSTIFMICASVTFYFLAYQEWTSSDTSDTDQAVSLLMALPMTLNNLAGGVAGGAMGIGPLQVGIYATLASYVSMEAGFQLGKRAVMPFDASKLSSIIFAVLGSFALIEAITK